VDSLLTHESFGRSDLKPASGEMNFEHHGFHAEPNDLCLNVPLGGTERRSPDTHHVCGSLTKKSAMSLLYVADVSCEETIRLLGLGRELSYLFGCWLAITGQ
jgi:hypothetical protein